MVECHLAKVKVAGPNPVSRSISGRGLRKHPRDPLHKRAVDYAVIHETRSSLIRHHSQVVRQGSAKPSFPGSNPGVTSILTKRYRCAWRKARRINRFRAFWGPDFFFQTIDANRCFRASAPIRTGRFPFSGRCIQPAPFLSSVFHGWQRYFSQKRITNTWASFCRS